MKIAMKSLLIPWEWSILQRLKPVSAGRECRKKKPSFTAGGNKNWSSICKRHINFSKTENRTTTRSSQSIPKYLYEAHNNSERHYAHHCSLQYCLQQPRSRTTQHPWMEKRGYRQIQTVELSSLEGGWNSDISYVNKTGEGHKEQNKAEGNRQILNDLIYMYYIKRQWEDRGGEEVAEGSTKPY